jgi:Type VIII secretion system (T8SS), CsgF protein
MKRYALMLGLLTLTSISQAAELDHTFSNPSFSGIGYSTHVLTIKQLEDQQKDKNKNAADALKAAAEAAAANTPQSQFAANVQSRIYSQLAKNITDQLFGATGSPTCTGSGANLVCPSGAMDIGGNTINWSLSTDGKTIKISVVNDLDASQKTNISVPVNTFGF